MIQQKKNAKEMKDKQSWERDDAEHSNSAKSS